MIRILSTCLLVFSCLFTLAADNLNLQVLDTYETGAFDDSAAEIGAFDPVSKRMFVVNGDSGAVDVLDLSDPSHLNLLFSIDISSYGDQANSVAVANGIVAVAVAADPSQDPGRAVFFDVNGVFLNQVIVGALPDMLIFTPDGTKVLVANEGEPNDDVTVDPEGSVSIIDLSGGVGSATVKHAVFTPFNGQTLDPSIRIFTPGSTVAQDIEPEYIAVSEDGKTAWVACQENNALAIIDIDNAMVTSLIGLGFKDHSLVGNGLDASNKDDVINITTWPVWGMYQPDALVSFQVGATTYLISANEGDSRDYDGFSEEERIGDLDLDPTAFPNAATLQLDENLGRLKTTVTLGDDDNDGDFDRLFAYGARSFSIWNGSTGALVYDSGDDLEQILAVEDPANFNSANDENDSFDNRSDDKGPEPEGVTIGKVGNHTYAFLGLERMGGIMVFDVTIPTSPQFVQYINNRDFSGDPEAGTAGDLGPEGVTFISATDSPNNHPLLVVMNEVSGTTTTYQINFDCLPAEILSVDDIGGRGITISGSYDCVYDVAVTLADGSTTTYAVLVGPDGTGYLDVAIEPDMDISVAIAGQGPSDHAFTVPTLGEWGLMIMVVGLLVLAVVVSRRRRLIV